MVVEHLRHDLIGRLPVERGTGAAVEQSDNEFDVVYINGDHNIPTVLTQTTEEGGATRVLKLRQIEPEFLERMFNVEDV